MTDVPVVLAELEMTCSMCLSFKARVFISSPDELDRGNIILNGLMSTHAETVHAVNAIPKS